MIKIFYFSGSGNSYKIAQYLQSKLQCDMLDLTSYAARQNYHKELLEVAIMVVPIYGQALVAPVIEMLKSIQAKSYCLLFTYGKMGTGHIIQDAMEYIDGPLIAAAIIPTNHSYHEVGEFIDYPSLEGIITKVMNQDYTPIQIPRLSKSMLAGVFPKLRTQMSVSIKLDESICNQCHSCNQVCPMQAIDCGLVNDACIRCLKCVHSCPRQALSFTIHPLLSLYLSKVKDDKLYVFL